MSLSVFIKPISHLEPNRTKIYADLLSAGIYLHEF
jgi:hypothetical protein